MNINQYNSFDVRASQLLSPFGTGSLIDVNNQSILVCDSENWKKNDNSIIDSRLEESLNSRGFIEPPIPNNKDRINIDEIVQGIRFPSWYFSPQSRELMPIEEWENKLPPNSKTDHNIFEQNPFYYNHKSYREKLVPVRIICACSNGHLQEFPWMEWCHGGKPKDDSKHSLSLRSRGHSSAISDLEIVCKCGKRNNLHGIFYKDSVNKIFSEMDVKCNGEFLWKSSETPEKCDCDVNVMLRNQSNLHFPIIKTSVNIPLVEHNIIDQIKDHRVYLDIQEDLDEYTDFESYIRSDKAEHSINRLVKHLKVEKNIIISSLRENLTRETKNISNMDYKKIEYLVLKGDVKTNEMKGSNFIIEAQGNDSFPRHQYMNHIENITLVKNVEIINALVGFTRIHTFESEQMLESEDNPKFVSLRRKDNRYVANKFKGEGIFFNLNPDTIDKWYKYVERTDPSILEEVQKKIGYVKHLDHSQFINPKLYLIHTLSHLLINELTNTSGYSSSSLKERIYFNEELDMYGVLIYAASSDENGTLGGLVKQGTPSNFFNTLENAINNATWCGNDPVCIDSSNQGRDSLNSAACHACSLISETSCEFQNVYLDRKMLIGTLENEKIGFFTGYNYYV